MIFGQEISTQNWFWGVLQENAWKESDETYYLAMKESVELLPVIQIGLAPRQLWLMTMMKLLVSQHPY